MAPSSSLVASRCPSIESANSKLKVQLKLSISRLRMVQQKDTAIAKQQRRQMAHLLEQGKEESARIRVENIIRSDITTELLEILELYCELLLARIGLLEPKECDPGLEEAIKSIIHAAPRTDVKELQQARQLLVEKYGKDFALEAVENRDGKVAERVVKKLKVEPPDAVLVDLYLKEIAKTYSVDWPKGQSKRQNGSDEEDDDSDPSSGQGVKNLEEPLTTDELHKATPPRDLGPKSPVSIAPPSPSTDNLNPRVKVPGPPELKPSAKMSGLKKQTSSTQAQSDSKGEGTKDQGKGGFHYSEILDNAGEETLDGGGKGKILYSALVTLQALTRTYKLALMISIVCSYGTPPKWSSVKLPAGRSEMACKHAYRNATEEAKGVTLSENPQTDADKKGAKKSKTTAAAKGKRARENEGAQESEASEAEVPMKKKVKVEMDDEKFGESKVKEV
ncbi:MAG: hypothetical protein Q9178_007314 [Gyalolechia marmorata]